MYIKVLFQLQKLVLLCKMNEELNLMVCAGILSCFRVDGEYGICVQWKHLSLEIFNLGLRVLKAHHHTNLASTEARIGFEVFVFQLPTIMVKH